MTIITKDYKRPLVIYHANCADGFGAAWCFHDHSEEYKFHPGVYQESPPDCTGRVVYLVDFSYKKEVVKDLCAVAVAVFLLDHHKAAIEDLASLSNIKSDEFINNFYAITDMNKSGAMIAWDFLHNALGTDAPVKKDDHYYNKPPLLLGHIEDRDLWRFELPRTREITAALFAYEQDFKQWDTLMSGGKEAMLQMYYTGIILERKRFKDIDELLLLTKRLMPIGDWLVPVACLPHMFASDAGNIMAAEYRDGTMFSACYYDTEKERVFSLRSTPNGMDVSAVAVGYGGGGHKNAAGFKVSRSHILARM